MKKKLVSILLACSMLLCTSSAFAASQLVIDREAVTIPAGMGSVKEMNDRIYVPVRFLAEYLGNTVTYSDSNMVNGVKTESATITGPTGTTYLVLRDTTQLYVLPGPNETTGGPIAMDVPAFIDDSEDRFYAPIRYLAQAMGYTVEWDAETETASITKAN